MPIFANFSDTNVERYDVIIAGSGHAAVSVARRASDRGLSVLMLESGMAEYDDDLQLRYTRMYGREHFDGSHWPQHWIRSLGGTSAVWQGWCAPLSERNLADWPVNRRDLNPYYLDATRYLQREPEFLTASFPFVDGFNCAFFSLGARRDLANEIPETYEAPPRIDVALRSTVSAVHPRSNRRGISAIDVTNIEGSVTRVALREDQAIVLAAGGMGNAQILLSSDHGENVAVGNDTDQVGRYLMEHPHLYGCGRVLLGSQVSPPQFPGDPSSHVPAMVPDDTLFKAIGSLDVSIELFQTKADPTDPTEGYLLNQLGEGVTAYTLNIRNEMRAEAANRVTVTADRNAAGLRMLQPTLTIGADAFRAANDCLQHFGDTLLNANTGRLQIVNDNLFHNPLGGGHTIGTTRMGLSPNDSVVDSNCRVHGYRNLFVAGSSVFRTGGYANPTLTIIALATRLGDYLGNRI